MAAAQVSKAFTTLRVVNIPWTVSDLQLKQHFSKFGFISRAKVVFDKRTGMSKNYGFLDVLDQQTTQKILGETHHLEGHDLYVKRTVLS